MWYRDERTVHISLVKRIAAVSKSTKSLKQAEFGDTAKLYPLIIQ